MKTRKLHNLTVSEVGMGCMAFSHGYGQIPTEQYSIEAIRNGYEHGCTFFDTAEVYSPGLSGIGHNELIVGKALKEQMCMKKLIAILMMLCLLCGAAMAETAPRILIAYVSRAGENYNVGTADPNSASAAYAGYIEKGNTQIVAETIAELTGGDLFAITTVEPYPDDYASMLTRAQEELDSDARPKLAGELPNLDDYGIIMIGYPIWHAATPRPVLTFLESYDLSGKVLVPFNTHEGSGQSGTVSEIAASAPNAEMLEGIAIQGKVAQEDDSRTRELLTEWLGELKLIP